MKKLLYIFMIFTLVLCTCNNVLIAAVPPRLGVASPSSGTVEVGGTIRYTVNIYNATNVTLNASHIRVSGVSANISVEGSGNTQRTIVLTNIQGSVGARGYISYIAAGVATNEAGGNMEMNFNSTAFTIVATQNPTPEPPQNNNNTNNNNNNNNYNNNNNNNYLPPNIIDEPTQETPQEEEKEDKQEPTMQIGALSNTTIQKGDTISFDIKYNDETEMGEITLNNNDITLYGFTADVQISGDGNTRKVTLSNVQGNLGGLKYVKIASNTAKDKAGNLVTSDGQTFMFKVIDSDTKNNPDDWIENPNTGR